MKWPTMFEWLFDMYMHGNPDASIRFGMNHGTSIFVPLAFFLLIGYCYLCKKRRPQWRGKISLTEEEDDGI